MRIKKDFNVQIGERVRLARDAAGFTQEQLAERVGVSPQYVSDLERGVVGLSVPTLRRICLALHISSDSILFGGLAEDEVSEIAEKCRLLPREQLRILSDIIDRYAEAVQLAEHTQP